MDNFLNLANSETKANNNEFLQYWESENTRPAWTRALNPLPEFFYTKAQDYLNTCLEHPYLPKAIVQAQTLERVRELVELAYNDIPVYRDKYRANNFCPADLRCYDDIQKIPVISKQELIEAFPARCLNRAFKEEDLFPTRSSGSSGQTLLIRVDEAAILLDTVQGIRQLALQSNRKYRPEHMLTHLYTVPWWYDSVLGRYQSSFISNVIKPEQVAIYLQKLAPHILSCYPSNLEALMPFAEQFRESLILAVTHSEASTPFARKAFAACLECPVLDEYSSEEATRIALEMPCGHYHVCEDSVHLDVLDPQTFLPTKAGESGLAVITNLLNTAMPFIRYVQGDALTLPSAEEPCEMKWSQIKTIDGRLNDGFINKQRRKIPAGSLLDISYRWMFDRGLHLEQFELVQKTETLVEVNTVLGSSTSQSQIESALPHLVELMSMCMDHPITIGLNIVAALKCTGRKRRPIRCEVNT